MTIKIVTDSTCDLPQKVIDELDITVIPLFINIGEVGYLDGVELTRQEFYQRLPEYDPHPTTATPGSEVFRRAYESLAAQGATQILSIHISRSLSATVEVARAAARETILIPVTVLDARQLSLGTGFQVETAARAAREGRTMEEILALLDDQITRTHVFAALDTLEYLRRSGRMNGAISGLGNLLQIKPLLHMHNGNPATERVRTTQRAIARLLEILREVSPLEQVALVHTHAAEQAEELYKKALDLLPQGEIISVDITPVIGANIGPGAVGFACIAARTD
jgi:DegV family protein with EDD domain